MNQSVLLNNVLYWPLKMSVSDDIMLSLHFQDQTSLSTGLEPFKNSIFDLIKTDKIDLQ